MSDDDYSPYCPSCGACGVPECCSPTMCKHDANCLYPRYRNDWVIRFMRWALRHRMRWIYMIWRRFGGLYD